MPQRPKQQQKVTKQSTSASEPIEIKIKKSEGLFNKLRPVLNARANAMRPDLPLAPTPEPAAIDNTFVKKPIVKRII